MSIFGTKPISPIIERLDRVEQVVINETVDEAIELGLLDKKEKPVDENNDPEVKIMNEAMGFRNYQTEVTRVKRTRAQKVDRLTHRASILLARENKDADYVRYTKLLAQLHQIRSRIQTRYKGKAMTIAREVTTGARKRLSVATKEPSPPSNNLT
jgi:hypothetical protein